LDRNFTSSFLMDNLQPKRSK